MIRYSSSVHKSDWECSSKSVRGSFFVNPLYIKNLTNLTNLTTLQTLQPYRQCVDTFLFCAACTGGEAFVRATCTGFKLEKWHFPTTEWLVPLGPGANQRYGMETVWTVKNKKDPPKQVLLVAASPQPGITRFYPQPGITRFYPGCWWHSGDAASRPRWTPRHRQTVEWSGSIGPPGLRRFLGPAASGSSPPGLAARCQACVLRFGY